MKILCFIGQFLENNRYLSIFSLPVKCCDHTPAFPTEKLKGEKNMSNNTKPATFGSRFGYIMVAAGAAIGLGNIWKFPYLAYRGGGGIFLLTYIIIIMLMAHPMVEMENAIGRFGKSDTVTVFEKINPKWGFVGWIANICTLMINFYYVVVGGTVLKYLVQFITSGEFGDVAVFYNNAITAPVEPLIWSTIVLVVTSFMLLFGITEIAEKASKVMMPALFVMLIFCAFYGLFTVPGAVEGLKYYLIPAPENFSFKVFADAATQVLFSVGIGWGLFTTLGANMADTTNLKQDALLVSFMDTFAAITAGFVVIPTAYGAGVEMQAGPALLFRVMTGIYAKLPGGRFIGIFFFTAVLFAVISSLFSFFEVSMKVFEVKGNMSRKKAVLTSSAIILVGNILVSLGRGPLSFIKLPWPAVGGIQYYDLFDWLDCASGYVLLPLGCILVCLFVWKGWGWEGYTKELYKHDPASEKPLTKFEKAKTCIIIPAFMLIILLNVFGFLK